MSSSLSFFEDCAPPSDGEKEGEENAAVEEHGDDTASSSSSSSDDDADNDIHHKRDRHRRNDIRIGPTLSWKQWRQQVKRELMEYMTKRLLPPDDDEEEEEDENDEVVVVDEAGVEIERSGSNPHHEKNDNQSVEMDDESVPLESQQPQGIEVDDNVGRAERRGRGVATHSASSSRQEEPRHRQRQYRRSLQQYIANVPSIHATVPQKQSSSSSPSEQPSPPQQFVVRHDVHHLAELDDYTRTLSLSLTAVERHTPLRTVTRLQHCPRDWTHGSTTTTDDGPLAPLYNRVVSLHLRQLSETAHTTTTTSSELRQRAQKLHSIHAPNSRYSAHLYLYNGYATAWASVHTQLSRHCQRARPVPSPKITVHWYLSVGNVPAPCLLPHVGPTEGEDWYADTTHQQDRCVCLGDASLLKIPRHLVWLQSSVHSQTDRAVSHDDDDDDALENIRFDNTAVRLEGLLIERIHHEDGRLDDVVAASFAIGPDSSANGDNRIVATVTLTPTGESRVHSGLTIEDTYQLYQHGTMAADADALPTAETPHHQQSTAPPPPAVTTTTPGTDGAILDRRSHAVPPQPPIQEREYEALDDLDLLLETSDLMKTTSNSASCIIHLCCAVLSFTQPFRTKRGDWMMSLVLVDESLPLWENDKTVEPYVKGPTMNIFVKGDAKGTLPQLLYAGDVVQLNHVRLNKWKGNVQLLGVRNKSSYTVMRGNVDDPAATIDPSFTSSNPDFEVTDNERKRMMNLWMWSQQKRFLLHATIRMAHRFKLAEMELPGNQETAMHGSDTDKSDLTVMVAAIIAVPPDQAVGSPQGFLRVWDGTGAPQSDRLPLDTDTARESIRDGDPPRKAVVRISSIMQKLGDLRNNPDLQPPKALAGRVANVAIWEKQHWELIQNGIVSVGKFIRLRNVKDGKLPNQDLSCLNVYEKSSFTPLPDMTYEVLHLLEEHNLRLLRKEPINLDSGILPLDDIEKNATLEQRGRKRTLTGQPRNSPDRPLQPTIPERPLLQELLNGPVGTTFDDNVRLVNLVPEMSELSASGLQKICFRKADTWFYQFGLRVEDPLSSCRLEFVHSDYGRNRDERVGEMLFGMTAHAAMQNNAGALYNLHAILGRTQLWRAKGISRAAQGKKYFILNTLKQSA